MANQNLTYKVTVDGTETAKSKLASMTSSIEGMVTTTALVTAGFAAITAGVAMAGQAIKKVLVELPKQAVTNANEGFKAWRSVEAVINSTGRSAETTTQEMIELASQLQLISNQDDEGILTNVIGELMRFDAIASDVLPEAAKAVVNMAAKTGDLAGSAKKLGVALGDPIAGMTRLRQAGVLFNDEQKNLIKAFVESGRVAEAQQVILSGLGTKYQNQAAAMIDSTAQLKNAWDDYLQYLGQSWAPVLNGMQTGFAAFFLAISDVSANSSKEIMLANLEVERSMAERSSGVALAGKTMLDITFRYLRLNVNLIKGVVEVTAAAVFGLFNALQKEAWKASAWLLRNNPLNLIMQSNRLLLEKVFHIDTGDVFNGIERLAQVAERSAARIGDPWRVLTSTATNSWNTVSNTFEGFLNQLNTTQAQIDQITTNLDTTYNAKAAAITDLIADIEHPEAPPLVGSGAGNNAEAGTILSRYEQVAKMLEMYHADEVAKINLLYSEYKAAIDAATGQLDSTAIQSALSNLERWKTEELAKIAADAAKNLAELQAVELESIASYYEQVKFLDSNYYSWKTQQIQNQVNKMPGLTEEQRTILLEMLKKQLNDQRDVGNQTVEVIDTQSDDIKNIYAQIESAVSSSLTSLITGTQSFAEAMRSIWSNLANYIISEITRMILKMTILKAIQAAFTTATNPLGTVAGAVTGENIGLLGMPSNVAPIQTTIPIPSQNENTLSRLESRIDRLIETSQLRPPVNVTLRLGNREFRNAIQYSTIEANVM